MCKILLTFTAFITVSLGHPTLSPSNLAVGFNCNQTLSAPGTISSPNHPNNYPLFTSCTYVLTSHARVHLSFGNIQTEDCCDYIEVFDGGDVTAKRLERLSGNIAANTKSFTSTSNRLTVRFYSDRTVTFPGFVAYYKEVL